MGTSRDDEALTHWLTLELLSRYAEAMQANPAAEHAYPLVGEHLADCVACRDALDCLLAGDEADACPRIEPGAEWTAFLEEPNRTRWAWRPGSWGESFGLHVTFCIGEAVDERVAVPWPQATTGKPALEMDFKRDDERGLVIRLDGPTRLPALRAYLFVERRVGHADLHEGELRFEGVAPGAEVRRAGLEIETL